MPKRIGCFCNQNNNLFSVTRYLRDHGYEAELVQLGDEFPHFSPANDTYSLDFLKYCSQVDWGDSTHFNRTSPTTIASDFARFDYIIASGPVPAFAARSGRRVDTFIPYGFDITYLTKHRLVSPLHQLSYIQFVEAQKHGIRTARFINLEATNNDFEAYFLALSSKAQRVRIATPILYEKIYAPEIIGGYLNRTHWTEVFREIRRDVDLLILSHCRHVWTRRSGSSISLKGNDKLIRGVAEFHKLAPTVRTKLVLFQYGQDVAASRELVTELGIDHLVAWMPLMARKDIMPLIHLADIGCGEFANSWLGGGTLYEVIAMAKPLLTYREDRQYTSDYTELYPIMNVSSAEGIAAAIEDYVTRPDHYKEMGAAARAWFVNYVIKRPLTEIVRQIESA